MRHTLATTLLVSAVLLSNSSLPAATVTSTADGGPGSLRSALLGASPGDTINFAVTGAITLTSGELLVNTSLIINGPGATNLVIQRSSAGVPDFRIFNISSGIVTISGLTLKNGREAVGAGINNSTTLTLNDCVIIGSVATGKGGGINNSSTLIASNCDIQGNSVVAPAGVPGFGGGVFSDGTMTALFSTISSNSVTGGSGTNGFGGGVYNHGTMAFTNSAVNGNSATGGGDGYGGGIFNDGTVTIATTTVASNSASGVGGGMANNLGTVTLDRSTISGNVAQGGASGLANGGGMANILGTVIVDNSTISGNSSRLGGGGIFNDEGSVTLTHSTVTANDTEAIVNSDGVVEIGNTILAGNITPDLFTGQASDIHSDGFNLFGFLNISIAAGPGDRFNLTGSALKLGPLQDNGGPTFTHALLCGSPAINAGDNTGAPATDQRGFARIVGGIIDIGSYEFDTNGPIIICSSTNKTVEIGTAWRFDAPTDTSGTNTITIVSTVTNTAGHCGNTFDATRVWMANDGCGNSVSCSQKVTVVDTTAPMLSCSNTNKTVELGAPWTFDVPTATDNSGTNTITIVSTVTNTASHCGTTFDATRVWIATDDCGNSASCSQKVTVVDTTAPVITCSNTNKTVEIGTAWTFDTPTATDNSGTNTITIVSTVTNTASHCGTTFDATRVWIATDACSNSASCSQKVTVVDTTAPVITCSNTNKTVELGTAWTFDTPTATDNSDTNTITIVSTVTNTASHCGTTFDATRVWIATDACSNSASCSQKVTVVDTTAPVITCSNTNKTVELGAPWTFDVPTATDNSGTNTITIVSTVTNTAGHCGTTFDATRTWLATDLCGNSASCSQKVTVVDTNALVITCSSTNKTVELGTAWTFDAPIDNSGTNTITIVSTVTNTASHCGTTFDATRVWMATDNCGNSASCSQKVTVVDTTAPVITCSNTNKTIEFGTDWRFDVPTATDNSGTNTITIVSTVTNTASHCGTTFDATRVWMATDDCGNSASCSQKVTVVDTTAPVITCSNTNKTVELGTAWTFDIPTATDNSGTNTITIVSTVTQTASHCGTTFDATRVWMATDDCGNSASCSQKVTVVDTTAPVITCSNTNKTIEFGTAWTFDIPTATDNSGTNTITIVSTVTNTASHCGTTFDATRVWMATDDCGNSASCSQKVTVVDTTAPVITCINTNKTVEFGTDWRFDVPTATDNSGTNTITIVSTVTNTASHCGTTFDATRVWMATDDCGNSASCSQKVTVVDTTAPVITCSNTNKTIEFGTAWTFDIPTATDNSGTNTITIVSTVTNTASHCGTTFDATRVWIATDDCGNSASCSQKVTVVDTTAPVITCINTNKTVESGTDWRFDVPTATDNSGTNTITIVSTVTNTASHCGTTFDATRVWMATDDCGNSASCSQKVTVVDTTAPVITCINTNKTVELGTAWTFDIPTATDNSGTNTITIVSTVTNTASHCGTTFDATRVWMATDDCGNSASCSQKVTVVDTTAPVITCSNTNKTIEFGTAWTFDIPTATDNSGTNTITIVSTVTNTASHCGTTFDATRVWMATDDCGNSASCSQKVTVVDTTAPVITCSNTNKTIEFGTAWTFDIPTATDNSGTNTITIVSTVTNTASHCGTTFDATRVWMATDACGNSASCSQKVTVVDTTAPVITCSNTNKTIEFGTAWTFDIPTATDNSGTNTITIVSTVTNTASHCGTTFDATRVWMATDACGNSASCSQKVTVVDTTAPVITCSNTNKTVEFGTAWTFDAPTATDNSGTNTITIVSTVTNTAGHCGNTFDATRTWQAADGCGNSASCSQRVTVANTAPTITCAAPATVCTSSNSATVSVSVTVTDADGDGLSVIWMVDGVAVQTNQVPAGIPTTVALIEFTTVLAQGSHQINVSVSDASACRASCSSTIGVSSSLGDLYPIALSQKSLAGIAVGGVINDIYNGIKQGNFGWLTWRGSPSEPTLATSLTIPGNSSTYVNPKMPSDHVVSVGDWVQGKPGISNSDQVRKALNALEQIDITVPVWDRATGRGNNSLYHVVAFARVRILNYHLPHENRITARFLGPAQCD